MNQQEQDEQAAKDDLRRAEIRLRELQLARVKGSAVSTPRIRPGEDLPKAEMHKYCGASHPIAGCTLVLRFGTDSWDAMSYAPGYEPVGQEGMISNFFSRPLGSAGIAVDSFIRNGGNWKPDLVRMVCAEKAQSDLAGSFQSEIHGKIVDALCGMAVAGHTPAELEGAARGLSSAVTAISVSPCARSSAPHTDQ